MHKNKTSWNREQLFSSTDTEGSEDWATPQDLFDTLDKEYNFDLDAAASDYNTKVANNYITKEENSLTVDWSARGKVVWLNPPYGRRVKDFVQKCYEESLKGCVVVALVLVRTDTQWWQKWAMKAAQIKLIEGRIYFSKQDKTGPAPAPSALLVFDEAKRMPQFTTIKLPRGKT